VGVLDGEQTQLLLGGHAWASALVQTVEEINLSGRGRQPDPLIPHRLRRLEAAIGRPVPDAVQRARNAHRLHAALMDWQEDLLDEAYPARELLGAVDEACGLGAEYR
jgi:uncharacterized membrane protein